MNEKQEKRKRYNRKLEFIALFDRWLSEEPPLLLIWKWKKWIKNRPTPTGGIEE